MNWFVWWLGLVVGFNLAVLGWDLDRGKYKWALLQAACLGLGLFWTWGFWRYGG